MLMSRLMDTYLTKEKYIPKKFTNAFILGNIVNQNKISKLLFVKGQRISSSDKDVNLRELSIPTILPINCYKLYFQ